MLGMIKKSGIIALALILVAGAFAGIAAGWDSDGLPIEADGLHTATYVDGIVLDGINTDGEYDDAMTVTQWYDLHWPTFPNSTLHYSWAVTDTNLYLWADITSDNTTGGYLEAIIDFNDDGAFDSQDGDLYLKVEMNDTGVVELNYTYGSETVDGTAAFTDSIWDETDHMQFEFEFPLAILNETDNYSAYSLEGYGTLNTWGYPDGSSIGSLSWAGIGEWENATAVFGDSAYVFYTDDNNAHVQGYLLDDEGNITTDADLEIYFLSNLDDSEQSAYINGSFYEFDINVSAFGLFVIYDYTDLGYQEFYKIPASDITAGDVIELNYTVDRTQFDEVYTLNGTISDSDGEIDGTFEEVIIIWYDVNDGWGSSLTFSESLEYNGTDEVNETGFFSVNIPNGTWDVLILGENHISQWFEVVIDGNETLDAELETYTEWKSSRISTFDVEWGDDWLNATFVNSIFEYESYMEWMFTIMADFIGNYDGTITASEQATFIAWMDEDDYEISTTDFDLDTFDGETNYTFEYNLPTGDWGTEITEPLFTEEGTILFDGLEVNASADNHTITVVVVGEEIYGDLNYIIPYGNQIKNVTITYGIEEETFDSPFTSTPTTRVDENNFTVTSVGDNVLISVEDYETELTVTINTIPIDLPPIGLVDLELEEGHNLITFPYGLEESFSMYDIVAQDGVTSITYRTVNGVYHTILRDDTEFFGIDQELLPNTGYYIVVEEDVEINIVTDGEYASLAGLELQPGWNFIGITEYEGPMYISEILNYTLGTAISYHDGTEYKTILSTDSLSYITVINPGEAFWLFVGGGNIGWSRSL